MNYILNDLECEVFLFVDDTGLFSSADEPNLSSEILNRDLAKIHEWSKIWKVTFNPAKSKDMIFTKKLLANSPPVILNKTIVNRVFEHRHLGVWLSSDLDWAKQVKEVCMKANSKLSVLRSVKYLSRSTLDLLYKLTVRSVIDYGLVVFFHSLRLSEISRLDQIQYRAAKLCTGALHFTSQCKLEDDLGWETIENRANFLGLTMFKKIHSHQTRPLINKCMPQKLFHDQQTRHKYIYKLFPTQFSYFSRSFFPHFTKLFNNLDSNLTNEIDLKIFKNELKSLIKPKKSDILVGGQKWVTPF